MKEFDFDELDKAVTSVMGSDGSPSTQTEGLSVPAKTTADSPQTEANDAAQPPAEPAPPVPTPQAPSVVVPSTPTAAPATRRSGRFMDVVHPSSDMGPSSQPNREGVSIMPPAETAATPKPTDEPAAQQTVSLPDLEETATPEQTFSQDDTLANLPANTEPLSTPFLPDAKVEKRPLGGSALNSELEAAMAAELGTASNAATPSTETTSEAASTELETVETPVVSIDPTAPTQNDKPETIDEVAVDTVDDTQIEPTMEKTALPPELNHDLVEIEAGKKNNRDSEPTAPEASPSDAQTSSQTAGSSQAVSTGSIQPQYAEQPSTSDASHAAIFDSAAEHPPLNHPAKKKNGWLWIVVILILLVVGAVGGAAAYFFGLI